MLQWNTKFITLGVVILLVAIAAIGGLAHAGDASINFTW